MTISHREKVLALAMGGIVLALLNLVLLGAFVRRGTVLRGELSDRKAEIAEIEEELGQRDLWAARDAAISASEPKLTDESDAGVKLLDLIRGMARRHQVTIENESFGAVVKSAWFRSVPVALDTHSSWPDLIAFLYALQKPDQFIVCESAAIQVDPSDPTKMLGHFKIARWYAP